LATVSLYHYTFYSPPSLFYPGTERRVSFGPWPWYGKAVVVTAHPFDASNQDRTLVTDVSVRTTPDHFVVVTVRNVGVNAIAIYYIDLAVIEP
jgi:hypothetical protein